MKALLLSTYDFDGGASRAAYRLHKGLTAEGISSNMLVNGKFSSDAKIIGPKSKFAKGLNILRPELDSLPLRFYPKRLHSPWSVGWLPNDICSQITSLDPDIIHLHWVGFGFVPAATIARINKPVIWTFHDMWPFTGGCHYAGDCMRYLETCGNCPQLCSNQPIDLSRIVISRKLKHWQHVDFTIVAPSKWLASCAQSSSLFASSRIEIIPNGLDLSVYKPVDKVFARNLLNLPLNKKLILLGAINITGEPRKGFGVLQEVLPALLGSCLVGEMELLVVGSDEPENPPDFIVKTRYLGRWHDDISMALLYAAADVFVSPSLQDNLPNTIMEAMACGTPCVAFNIGGMPDMIVHKKNGYLAEPNNYEDFANGINWVLQDVNTLLALAMEARKKVETDFSLHKIAKAHVDLYREVLQGKR